MWNVRMAKNGQTGCDCKRFIVYWMEDLYKKEKLWDWQVKVIDWKKNKVKKEIIYY